MNRKGGPLREIYRNGVGAIVTSLCCSFCTFGVSQALLAWSNDERRSPELQSVISLAIFVVGYWVVYFALRSHVHAALIRTGLVSRGEPTLGSRWAKGWFICASEIFWIVSLGVTNLYLLRLGYSANASAAIAQWGVNLLVWLPLLPAWEWFALVWTPAWAVGVARRCWGNGVG
jgi:hypothetical protein